MKTKKNNGSNTVTRIGHWVFFFFFFLQGTGVGNFSLLMVDGCLFYCEWVGFSIENDGWWGPSKNRIDGQWGSMKFFIDFFFLKSASRPHPLIYSGIALT